MQIRRSRLVLVPTLVLASLIQACGQPPVPVKSASSSATSAELPAGHPPVASGTAGMPAAGDHADPSGHAQVAAGEFHFSGRLRISDELHARQDAAVFLSVRDQRTNELILSTRHTMDEFEEDGETWVAAFRLDDSSRMMGGTSRPRDVSVKAAYTPGGMLPAIGSTQPVGGSVTRTIGARAGVTDLEIVLE